MPKLWNNLSAKLWRAIPEGSRDELLGSVQGYVTQRGALSICSSNNVVLLTLEQDYGKLIASYALEEGFDGPVTYTLSDAAMAMDEVSEEIDPRTQLSLFDAPAHPVHAHTQEKRVDAAAFRAGSTREFADVVAAQAPTRPVDYLESSFFEPAAPAFDLYERAESAGLNPERDLASWVCGDENLFVHGAANAVAAGDTGFGGMLFVHGAAGMGKTHLLQAIGLDALKRNPNLRVRYMRGETFANAFIEALRAKEMEAFRHRTRAQVDLLLLDDVDFLAGKEHSQEELLHVLNDLLHAQKLVVVTSSVPRDALRFDARLRNRLASGLPASIDAPSTPSRREILARTAQDQQVHAPDDVLDYVAHTVRCNTREYLSHVSRVLSYGRFTRKPLTLEIARKQLESSYKQASRSVTMHEIVDATVAHYDMRPKEIIGRGRTKRVVTPRKVAMFLGRKLTEMSYPELGRFFDNRDHTTVLDAYRSIDKQREKDTTLRDAIVAIERALGVD